MKQVNYLFKNKLGFTLIMLFVFISIAGIAILQDFLHAKRHSGAFYFEESLLFKSLWFWFPPLLLTIKYIFTDKLRPTTNNLLKVFSVAAISHMLLVAITIWIISSIFREQAYGVFKVLSFTLSNDLVSIIIVYGTFLAIIKYWHTNKAQKEQAPSDTANTALKYMTINSGRNNELIKLDSIITIRSATPYISVELAEKTLLHSATLKSITSELDDRFIRIHRSMIVNIDKVTSYKSRLNGDYDLILENGTEVRLSRNYVKAFKQLFKSTHPLTI